MVFESLQELEKYLQGQIEDTLNKDMAQYVKDEITVAVGTDVYESGEPKVYVRRAGNEYGGMKNARGTGSLADPEVMKHEVVNGELTVTNEAGFNPGYSSENDAIDRSKSLAENIHYGYGSRKTWWNVERPFMDTARKNVKDNMGEIMTDGLKKRLGNRNVERR